MGLFIKPPLLADANLAVLIAFAVDKVCPAPLVLILLVIRELLRCCCTVCMLFEAVVGWLVLEASVQVYTFSKGFPGKKKVIKSVLILHLPRCPIVLLTNLYHLLYISI